jgi:fatty acid desaturase
VALLVGVAPLRLLLFYVPAGVVWSTVQYLEHAFAPRDIDRGAFNLAAPAWLSWLNLHRELDLSHHLHPGEPWVCLPRLSPPGEPRRSYFRHYLSQWKGPRLTLEAGPSPRAPTA